MSHRQYCPECEGENPVEARYCMNCGRYLASYATPTTGSNVSASHAPLAATAHPGSASQVYRPGERGFDWAAAIAAALAFLSLRRLSHGTRGGCTVLLLLMLFFGCPMVCGFITFAMDWFARLFQ